MADEPASFDERFNAAAAPSDTLPSTEMFGTPEAMQVAVPRALKAVFGGLSGYNLLEYFGAETKQAVEKGLTPEREAALGATGALATVGSGAKFAFPPGLSRVIGDFHEQVLQPAAERAAANPTAVEKPIGTDVPANVPRSQLALTGEPHIDAALNDPILKQVIDNPIIDREHEIPNSWGGSLPVDNPVTYIDRDFPRALTVDGVTFDPASGAVIHENVEELIMTQLMKSGMSRDAALRAAYWGWGNPAEHAWYQAHGMNPDHVEAALKPYLDQIAARKANPANIPADLFKETYPNGDPLEDTAGTIDKPSTEEAARAKQIIADWQAKSPPSPEPGKAPIVNPLQEARELGVIGPERVPHPEDTPAQAAQRAIPASRRQSPDDRITMTPAGEPISAWEARFKQWVKDLKSPEEVKPLIEESAAKNNNFPEARAGEINPAHIEVLADAAGIDPTKIDRGLLTQFFNTPDKIRMGKQLLDSTLQDFRDAAARVASDPSEANLQAMLAAEIKRDYALEQILGLRAEWGRSGHALRDLLQKVEGESAVNDLLKSKGRTPQDMENIAKALGNMDAPSAARLMTSMRGQQPHWFYWLWVNGLISGPFTHTKYVAANALYAASERGITTPLAALIGRLRGNPEVFFGESPASLWGMVSAVPDAIRAAGETVRSGMRVQLASEKELVDRLTEAGEKVPASLLRGANPVTDLARPLPGVWGRIGGAPSDMASGIHTFFKVLGERASLDAWAYNQAAKEGLKITDRQFWDRMAWHKANPTTAVLKDSVYQAYKDTFMQDLPPELARRAAALKGGKITGWIFPFTHIPINLMRATLEHAPFLNLLDSEVRADLLGRNGQRKQDLAISRMVAGSALMGYFAHKYMSGQATGGYPHDPKERREWQLTGKIPYAVQGGDQWHSFERFGPAGSLAGLGTDIGRIVANSDTADPENWTKMVWYATQAAADAMADFPGFQSIQNFIKAIDDPQEGKRFMAWEAGSLLPFSSLISQTASFMDPSMRRARTFVDGLLYRLPGARESLAPKRDPIYGEPVQNPGYASVIRNVPVNKDPVKAELDKLGYYPMAPRQQIGGVKLTPEQYDKYQATAGPMVKQGLNELIHDPMWTHIDQAERIEMVRQTISYFRKQAATAMHIDEPQLILDGNARRIEQISGPQ